jgi:hypothetical protein
MYIHIHMSKFNVVTTTSIEILEVVCEFTIALQFLTVNSLFVHG